MSSRCQSPSRPQQNALVFYNDLGTDLLEVAKTGTILVIVFVVLFIVESAHSSSARSCDISNNPLHVDPRPRPCTTAGQGPEPMGRADEPKPARASSAHPAPTSHALRVRPLCATAQLPGAAGLCQVINLGEFAYCFLKLRSPLKMPEDIIDGGLLHGV